MYVYHDWSEAKSWINISNCHQRVSHIPMWFLATKDHLFRAAVPSGASTGIYEVCNGNGMEVLFSVAGGLPPRPWSCAMVSPRGCWEKVSWRRRGLFLLFFSTLLALFACYFSLLFLTIRFIRIAVSIFVVVAVLPWCDNSVSGPDSKYLFHLIKFEGILL